MLPLKILGSAAQLVVVFVGPFFGRDEKWEIKREKVYRHFLDSAVYFFLIIFIIFLVLWLPKVQPDQILGWFEVVWLWH